jgi:hypothetical protein
MFKKLTEQDVQDAIIELIEANETATALDVKKSLRKSGFWALQANVSKIIRDNYSKWGLEKENNGVFNTYTYAISSDYDEGGIYDDDGNEIAVYDDDDDEGCVYDDDEGCVYDDDDESIFGCCATSGQLNRHTTDDDDEPEPVRKLEYGKVIEGPKMLSSDTYQLVIIPSYNSSSDEAIKLVVSNRNKIVNAGTLVYEVRAGKDSWYLYSENPNVITRHKAIYYVWRVVSQEYNGFLDYADMRSTKLWR